MLRVRGLLKVVFCSSAMIISLMGRSFAADKDPIIAVYEIYEGIKTKQATTDVHSFNREMNWKVNLPKIAAIDGNLYQSKKDIPLTEVEKEILASDVFLELEDKDQRCFKREFSLLKNYLVSNPFEMSEVGYNIQHLLSQLWWLSNQTQLFGRISSKAFIFSREGAINALINTISTNITEGGGCFQGYAGRLALNYLQLLHSITYGPFIEPMPETEFYEKFYFNDEGGSEKDESGKSAAVLDYDYLLGDYGDDYSSDEDVSHSDDETVSEDEVSDLVESVGELLSDLDVKDKTA